ncbi:hypothetical protein [Achromobacter mucicolens]|uniref:hypothetical protein n=1 Tax=Achromobacter mucicolens TaxID=1389922 RepID=UPI001CBC641D|nr:hypothetical protein [Achromobacter mucicolens]UAN04421.1 hypothetical protein K9D24_09905 [Achromobacter mucicolens]
MADLERIKRVMQMYRSSREDAARYLDLREEGYSTYQAAVMAGISDPHDPEVGLNG